MQNEKKFQLPKSVLVGEKLEAIEAEINRIHQELEKSSAPIEEQWRDLFEEDCKCWPEYTGLMYHTEVCPRKGQKVKRSR